MFNAQFFEFFFLCSSLSYNKGFDGVNTLCKGSNALHSETSLVVYLSACICRPKTKVFAFVKI